MIKIGCWNSWKQAMGVVTQLMKWSKASKNPTERAAAPKRKKILFACKQTYV